MFGPQGQYTSVPICALSRDHDGEPSESGRKRGDGAEWCVKFRDCPAARTAVGTE
jgi:hypothetical protein